MRDVPSPRHGLDVAIIGMAGRFPGANDTETYWQNLCSGVESVRVLTDDELIAAGVSPATFRLPQYVRSKGVLDDMEWFDAAFFGMSAREAEVLDPQQRIFLECCWEALEAAGYAPEEGRGDVGVYAGLGLSAYFLQNLLPNRELHRRWGQFQVLLANEKDFLPTRVSYKLNLHGPSVCVQTACSTSLVAVHLACRAVLAGDCDMALAGGVTIGVPHRAGYLYQEGGIQSPDGHCRAFDARAEGMVGGDGAGVVLLKRLEWAIRDRDTIRAVIRGTAINNDGSEKIGFTAPSQSRQAAVIRTALERAGAPAETIAYVEAHGTGTPLGDPIEVAALDEAFGSQTRARKFCLLGAVKSNIGHLDTAAGVAGLIKTTLAVERGLIPPSLHFETPNPRLDYEQSAFSVCTRLTEWPAGGTPRRAGVSSFGMGGTNAHAILEQAPALPPREPLRTGRSSNLFVISGRTPTATETVRTQLAEHLQQHSELDPGDVAFTLQAGRAAFAHRAFAVAGDRASMIDALNQPLSIVEAADTAPRVAFLFPGQGSHHPGMARGLYASERIFRDAVDRAIDALANPLASELRAILTGTGPAADVPLRTRIAQPFLFACEYAISRVWMEWGIRPTALIGHSLGEYAAACVSGVWSLEDAMRLVAERGRLMDTAAAGAMLAVFAHECDVARRLPPSLSIAAINGPQQCVVAGDEEGIRAFEARLAAEGVQSRRLSGDRAFHSRLLEPILDEWGDVVGSMTFDEPRIPFLSNVTGQWITRRDAADPRYWVRHARETVQFSAAVPQLLSQADVLIECGPGQTLAQFVRQQIVDGPPKTIVTSLPRIAPEQECSALLHALGAVWASGAAVRWDRFNADAPGRRLPLPTYPFERRRYWLDPPHRTAGESVAAAATPRLRAVRWRETPLPPKAATVTDDVSCWWWFVEPSSPLDALIERSREAEQRVIRIEPGAAFARLSREAFRIAPGDQAHYERLVRELSAEQLMPTRVVHAWNLAASASTRADGDRLIGLLWFAEAMQRARDAGTCDVIVLTAGVQRLDSEAAIALAAPAHAACLGFCDPNWRLVDLPCVDEESPAVAEDRAATLGLIWREITQGAGPGPVAWRDGRRFAQVDDAVPQLEVLGGAPQRLDASPAAYVVSTADEDRAQVWASQLNTDRHGAIVLRRPSLPGIAAPLRSLDLDRYRTLIDEVEREIAARWDTRSLRDVPGLEPALGEVGASIVVEYFSRNGIVVADGAVTTREEVAERLQVIPKLSRLLDHMLMLLEQAGVLRRDGSRIEWRRDATSLRRSIAVRAEVDAAYPELQGIVGLLFHCAAHYDAALAGRIDAIGVLYPDGTSNLIDESYRKGTGFSHSPIYRELLREVLDRVIVPHARGRLRLLEAGAGLGYLTRVIGPVLAGKDVEYHFTDLGKAFVIRAEREAAHRGLDWMRFATLDIGQPAGPQGFADGSVDVALAFNVVHATPRIADSLRCMKRLLAPGGVLCLIEAVRSGPLDGLIFGLAEGWWYFEDLEFRSTSPLVGIDTWERVLADVGFARIQAHPAGDERRARRDFALLLAQQSASEAATAVTNTEAPAIRRAPDAAARITTIDAGVDQPVAEVLAAVAARGAGTCVIASPGESVTTVTAETVAAWVDDVVRGGGELVEACRTGVIERVVFCHPSRRRASAWENALTRAAAALTSRIAQDAVAESGARVASVRWEGDALPLESLGTNLQSLAVPKAAAFVVSAAPATPEAAPVGEPTVTAVTDSTAAAVAPAATPAPSKPQQKKRHPRPPLRSAFAAPQTATERFVAGLWQDLFDLETVGLHDDFFELGGDSLLALQLISAVRVTRGRSLPVHALVETPTVAAMARLIDGTPTEAPAAPTQVKIVTLRPASSDRALFLIHPGGGSVYPYRFLASRLASDVAVYGIQCRGFELDEEPLTSVGEMARQYIDAILPINGRDDPWLGGASFGGAVAFEMAQQLRAMGRRCGLVALFDTPPPDDCDTGADDAALFSLLIGEGTRMSLDYLRQLSADERVSYLADQLRVTHRLLPDIDRDQARRILRVWKTNLDALGAYRPSTYPGELVFFRARERMAGFSATPETTWASLAQEGCHVHVVPGGHDSMFDAEHVDELARRLDRALAHGRVDTPDGRTPAPPPSLDTAVAVAH